MEDLKNRIFRAIDKEIELQDFEEWLYEQNDLVERMDEDLLLELFNFNYNQRGACYEFKNKFPNYFDEDEYVLWKILFNLRTLSKGAKEPDRIIGDLYDLSHSGYEFLYSIGSLEDYNYFGWAREEFLKATVDESKELLLELEEWLSQNPTCDLKEFRRLDSTQKNINTDDRIECSMEVVKQNKWWEFWK